MLDNRNLAYDLSLFEEAPKKSNVVRLPRVSHKTTAKLNALQVLAICAIGLVCAGATVLSVYNHVLLNELTSKISLQEKALRESESVYTQQLVRLENKLSTSNLEEYATSVLGMVKRAPEQQELVVLGNNF